LLQRSWGDRTTVLKLAITGIVVGLIGLVACADVDPYGDLPPRPDVKSDSLTSCASAPSMAGTDPTRFKECKGTKAGNKGRCVPESVLGTQKGQFEQANCDPNQDCLPEDLVRDGSNVDLKKCTILGNEGRCFWPLAKQMLDQYDTLKGMSKGQCTADTVCAPCVNPLTREDTKVCTLGKNSICAGKGNVTKAAGPTCPQKDPSLDTSAFTQDTCGSGMLCVDTVLVGDQAKMLKDCSKGKCAPKKAIERGGNYVPPTCRSIGKSEGRCMNTNIPMLAAQASLLPKEGCDPDEACAPCFDPRTGQDTGACHSAPCDAPKEPAKTFAKCCGGRGQCVPTENAGGSADMLAKDSCSGDTPLCAPNELSGAATPQKCKALLFLEGICVSKCTLETIAKDFIQGSCPDGDMCAPCNFLPDGTCK
jgi:hypothetical protein